MTTETQLGLLVLAAGLPVLACVLWVEEGARSGTTVAGLAWSTYWALIAIIAS